MVVKIKEWNIKSFTVNAMRGGKVLEEREVSTRSEAEEVADEFEAKYGEYTTSIKVNW